jgi:hypothetical protein
MPPRIRSAFLAAMWRSAEPLARIVHERFCGEAVRRASAASAYATGDELAE